MKVSVLCVFAVSGIGFTTNAAESHPLSRRNTKLPKAFSDLTAKTRLGGRNLQGRYPLCSAKQIEERLVAEAENFLGKDYSYSLWDDEEPRSIHCSPSTKLCPYYVYDLPLQEVPAAPSGLSTTCARSFSSICKQHCMEASCCWHPDVESCADDPQCADYAEAQCSVFSDVPAVAGM